MRCGLCLLALFLVMSADDPFSFLPAEQAKPAKKTHWKTKLFSKDKTKAASQQHQEIADFQLPRLSTRGIFLRKTVPIAFLPHKTSPDTLPPSQCQRQRQRQQQRLPCLVRTMPLTISPTNPLPCPQLRPPLSPAVAKVKGCGWVSARKPQK